MKCPSIISASLMLVATALPAAAQEAPAAAAARPVPPVVEKWAAAWNTDDAAGMAALFTPDGVYEDFAFQAAFQGQGGVQIWVEITAKAIPDARVEIIDAFQIGDRAAVRWIFHGTPNNFAAIPGTGKSFAVPAVSIFEMEGERIEKVSDFYNLADVFRQVGIPSGPWVPPNP